MNKWWGIIIIAYFILIGFLSWSPEYSKNKERVVINRVFIDGRLVTVDTLKIK